MGDVVRTCTVDECSNKYSAKGLCNKHYTRLRLYGRLHRLTPDTSDMTDEQRFWMKVNKTDDCWIWTGSLDSKGYGSAWAQRKHWRAHRYSYGLEYGPIEPGMTLHHTCRVRSCVRPEHLSPVTSVANSIEALAYKADHHNCYSKSDFLAGLDTIIAQGP